MTITEANALNVVCRHLGIDRYTDEGRTPSRDQAVEALGYLADRASKALSAGVDGDVVRAKWVS